jgi:PTS system ascorbate-specific IIA component
MNSILIIAHTPLASALRSAALHVFPDAAARVAVMDVPPMQPPEKTLDMARELLAVTQSETLLSEGSGTLVMSDIMGATPCNVAQKLVDGAHTRCVAGASLPMLLRAITYWDGSLALMAEKALMGGSQGAVEVA